MLSQKCGFEKSFESFLGSNFEDESNQNALWYLDNTKEV